MCVETSGVCRGGLPRYAFMCSVQTDLLVSPSVYATNPEVEFREKSSSTAQSVIELCLKKAGYEP